MPRASNSFDTKNVRRFWTVFKTVQKSRLSLGVTFFIDFIWVKWILWFLSTDRKCPQLTTHPVHHTTTPLHIVARQNYKCVQLTEIVLYLQYWFLFSGEEVLPLSCLNKQGDLDKTPDLESPQCGIVHRLFKLGVGHLGFSQNLGVCM